jgi:hypothetical protein
MANQLLNVPVFYHFQIVLDGSIKKLHVLEVFLPIEELSIGEWVLKLQFPDERSRKGEITEPHHESLRVVL